jgi:hypothetical protein
MDHKHQDADNATLKHEQTWQPYLHWAANTTCTVMTNGPHMPLWHPHASTKVRLRTCRVRAHFKHSSAQQHTKQPHAKVELTAVFNFRLQGQPAWHNNHRVHPARCAAQYCVWRPAGTGSVVSITSAERCAVLPNSMQGQGQPAWPHMLLHMLWQLDLIATT